MKAKSMTGIKAQVACSEMLTAFAKIQLTAHMSCTAYARTWRIAEDMILKYGAPRTDDCDETGSEETREYFIAEARKEYACDELEIDDIPDLSVGEDGAFVSAWVWVPNPKKEDDE